MINKLDLSFTKQQIFILKPPRDIFAITFFSLQNLNVTLSTKYINYFCQKFSKFGAQAKLLKTRNNPSLSRISMNNSNYSFAK